MRNQRTWRWFGKFVGDYQGADAANLHGIDPSTYGTSEHAIRIKGDTQHYEIGVMRNPKGPGFVCCWDFWGAHGKALENVAGDKCRNLFREYGKKLTIKTARKMGVPVKQTSKGGKIQLVLG